MNTIALLVVASPLINLLLNIVLGALAVCFIVWAVTKVAGPPNIPEPFRWVIWVFTAIAVLVLVCWMFGIRI